MTQNTKPTFIADAVCRTRSELLDRLAGTLEKLGRVKLKLRSSLEEDADWAMGFVANEVELLRSECVSIRAELEYHRTVHGC